MAGFDVEGLDEVIHGRLRLGIMAYLAHAEAADFNELKSALNATQGNLSIHPRNLEAPAFVPPDKSFLNRNPQTRARLTEAGRAALKTYLDALSKLVDDLK